MLSLLTRARRLRAAGVLGMNRRNQEFVQTWNPRRLYPNVDDKLRTKRLVLPAGFRIPRTHAVVRFHHQVGDLPEVLQDLDSFVIKPVRGSGGEGILVAVGRQGEGWRKASGAPLARRDIARHVEDVLGGLYSLGGRPDRAMIEEHLEVDPALAAFSHGGLPDVRVVVYRGFPVMAMTRLPTDEADGKANLHQGAVGVGLSIRGGEAVGAVQHDRPAEEHPDTGRSVLELSIPHWEEHLHMAAQAYELTGLGYLGVDLVLAEGRGPTLLELNARPGLGIQIANGEGLLERLKAIDSIEDLDLMSSEERVDLCRRLFPLGAGERTGVTAARR